MSILLTAASSLLAALAVEPGVRTTEENQRKVAQIRASMLSGEWGWVRELWDLERRDLYRRILVWADRATTMDEARSRLTVLHTILLLVEDKADLSAPSMWFRGGERIPPPADFDTSLIQTSGILYAHEIWAIDVETRQAILAHPVQGCLLELQIIEYLEKYLGECLDNCETEILDIPWLDYLDTKVAWLKRGRIEKTFSKLWNNAIQYLEAHRYVDALGQMDLLRQHCIDPLDLNDRDWYQIRNTWKKMKALVYLDERIC